MIRWLLDWRNGATVVASVVVVLLGITVSESITDRNRAFDLAERTLESQKDQRRAATRRIDLLTNQVGALTEQVAALRQQLLEAGVKPKVTSPAVQRIPRTTPTSRVTNTRSRTVTRTRSRTKTAPVSSSTTTAPTTTRPCTTVPALGRCP